MRFSGVNYARQVSKSDCALVAFANSLKWAGVKFNYRKELDALVNIFKPVRKVKKGRGTNIHRYKEFFKVMKKELPNNVPYNIDKIKDYPNVKEINKHLDNGGAIIFTYNLGDNDAGYDMGYHTAFIIKRSKQYYIVNLTRTATISAVDNDKFPTLLSNHSFGVFISKRT
jgi:hypothetical protein